MKIVINNIELKNFTVKEFKLKTNVSNHTELFLELNILNEISIEVNSSIIVDDFYGIVKNYRIINYGLQGVKLEIVAYSYTLLLDKEPKTRVFQDEFMSYKEIISKIMESYNLKCIISDKLSQKTNKMYLQDDISDFKFIIRILSDIKEGIFYSSGGIILFGFQDANIVKLKNIVSKGRSDIGIYYEIVKQVVFSGDKIENMYVISSETTFIQGIYHTKLNLSLKNNQIPLLISNIKGRFLPARVVEVNSVGGIAKMKVDFGNIDIGKNKRLISFSTPYSKTMTSLYITPEISDMVAVYFPSNYEKDCKVAFCIDNNKSDRFCNKNNRNFMVEDMNISISKGLISLNTDKFSLVSKKDISIASNGFLAIETQADTSIYADNLSLVSKKGNIELNSTKDLLLKAIKIHNN